MLNTHTQLVTATSARITSMGTPLYLAPEAAVGSAMCSLASDVYSASLVAVELVTRSCVHNERTGGRDASRAERLAGEAQVRVCF